MWSSEFNGKWLGKAGNLSYNHFMFNAGSLTFQEFIMSETLPLATIQQAVLEFLHGRDDAVVFGAQAVNAYVPEPRRARILICSQPACGTWRRTTHSSWQ